jgi:hypothetical protein
MQLQPAGKLLDTLVKTANRMRPPGSPQPPMTEKQLLHESFGTDDISGLDRDRQLGAVGYLDADPAKCRLVVMLPITDADKFRALLGRLGVKLEKSDKMPGVEGFGVPYVQTPFFLRFHDRYVYATAGDPAALDPQRLPSPTAVFDAKETSAFALRLRLDRVPESLRTQMLSAADEWVRREWMPQAPPEIAAVSSGISSLFTRYGRSAVTDGRDAIVRYDLDPKTASLLAELSLTPKPGTTLAKEIADFKSPANRFAELDSPDAAASILLRAPLFTPELRKAADNGLGEVTSQFVGPGWVAELIKALRRSVQAGDVAFGSTARGPDRDGRYTVAAGLTLADTKELEKAVRSAITDPRQAPNVFKLDAEKAGTISVHYANLFSLLQPPEADPLKKVFGDGPVRFAFAPDAFVVAFGPDGLTRLTEALAMKPKPAPCVDATLSVQRLLPLLGRFDANAEKQAREYIGDLDRLTVVRLTADGGSAFTLKLTFSALLMPRASAGPPPLPPG